MAALLAVNESLLECKVPTNEKAREIVEKVIKRFADTDEMFMAAVAMGIDPETDDFMAADAMGIYPETDDFLINKA